jgi:hypothetical protein
VSVDDAALGQIRALQKENDALRALVEGIDDPEIQAALEAIDAAQQAEVRRQLTTVDAAGVSEYRRAVLYVWDRVHDLEEAG